MADRFPSLEGFSSGKAVLHFPLRVLGLQPSDKLTNGQQVKRKAQKMVPPITLALTQTMTFSPENEHCLGMTLLNSRHQMIM